MERSLAEIKVALSQQTAGRSFVYFIECAGFIKIGYTASVTARLTKMFTDLPVEPRLLHFEDADRRVERILHREFASFRTRGEWFKADVALYEHIRRRCIVLGKPVSRHVSEVLAERAPEK